jgi:SAM-dependent methyltransferase
VADIIPVGKHGPEWFIDTLEIDLAGIVQVRGWSHAAFTPKQNVGVFANSERLSLLQTFRYPRPDVPLNGHPGAVQTGLMLEYAIPDELLGREVFIKLDFGAGAVSGGPYRFVNAHYRPLFDTDQVFHRAQIYGSGLPNTFVHPDILAVAKDLRGPILDFGCGRGALMLPLLEQGLEVRGLELESRRWPQAIPAELERLITLYDGSFPVSFEDSQFRSVVCSEVLEHMPDYQSAVAEIARITSETALFTVPNASAIPLGFRHGAVPWHLLESTHVNFFSQKSLEKVLAPHFRHIEFGRIGAATMNDSAYFVSLMALCSK